MNKQLVEDVVRAAVDNPDKADIYESMLKLYRTLIENPYEKRIEIGREVALALYHNNRERITILEQQYGISVNFRWEEYTPEARGTMLPIIHYCSARFGLSKRDLGYAIHPKGIKHKI